MSKKVLIADDEQNIVISVEFLMRREGFEVSVAHDGEAALERIRADKPDLKAKIIITTNLELSEENRAAIEAQADGYVVKADLTPRQMAEFLAQLNV